MDVVFTRGFWGILILLIGLSIVLNAFFKINIPVVRIFFSLLLIYIGITMLIGISPFKRQWMKNGEQTTLFSETRIFPTAGLSSKYTVIFGSQVVDLSNLKLVKNEQIEINCIFASQKLILPRNVNIKVVANSAFGSARMPNGTSAAFGEVQFTSPEYIEGQPILFIKADVVFGDIQIAMR